MRLWFDGVRDDLKFAVRQLVDAPGFTLVAILTLALGIGANSAIFALVDATLLRPLPFAHADQLVTIWERHPSGARSYASPVNITDWRDRSRTLEEIAGFVPGVGGMVMAGADGQAETVSRQWVTAGLFDVLGVPPIAGRTFSGEDDTKRVRAIVLSEGFWRTRFSGDPSVIGRDIRLDGQSWTVVGVVPKEFQLLGNTSIWALQPIRNAPPRAWLAYVFQAVGRLRPGVSVEAAEADLRSIADALAREFPQFNRGRSVRLESMHDTFVGSDLRLTSLLFLGVVGFVLLICCANVANLLMARATVRRRELAVRSALGAGRRRIVRQLLTESVLLAAVGGIVGTAVGAAILRTAPAMLPAGLLPATITLAFDGRVVTFCLAAALLVGAGFGLMPAWKSTDFSAAGVTASDTRTGTAAGGTLRSLLVAGQLATAVVLLFGAGLLLRTLIAVEAFDRGYRAGSVLTMLVDPLGSKYPTSESLQQFYDQVAGEVRAVPGVAEVAWASQLPLDFFESTGFSYEVVGDAPVDERERPTTEYQVVSPEYFDALELPVVAGRAFNRTDARDAIPVCIVNEAFARKFDGRSPIGQRLALRPISSPQAAPVVREIVGVAQQVKGRPDERQDFIQIYVPMAQDLSDDMFLVVRPTSGRADALAASVRAAISRIDREQLVSVRDIMTLDDIAWVATGRQRFRAVLVVAFAGVALALAMVGLFGILAYSVQQQRRDFGVRRALGATTSDIFALVGRQAARVIGVGAIVGLGLSAIGGRLIESMLFGVRPLDVWTFVLVGAVLALTATVSVIGPAWRAARVDPAVALRNL